MLRQKAPLLFTCLLAFASLTQALPPKTPWIPPSFMSKPVYSRAIGGMPPQGISTISVPYMPKSPLFPKFVDPKMMISKKTDMLGNLFGGMGPVAYNMADTKPITPYSGSELPFDSTDVPYKKRDILTDNKLPTDMRNKRGMFGPFAPKFGPMGPMGSMGPMGPMGSMGPMGPMSPKFGPFSGADAVPDYSMDFSSRRRRSIVASPVAENAEMGASAAGTKPSGVPKEYLPGMMGPFGPYGAFGPFGPVGPVGPMGPMGPMGPVGPAVDPSAMMGKKSAFLDTILKNIGSTTPEPVTDVPIPKSTIVPPSYWMPSSVIPGPTEYTSKVSDFLNKLFDSLNLNATTAEADGSSDTKSEFMRSLESDAAAAISADRVARASGDLSAIATAKDTIVDTILSELSDLKGDMMATLNDLIAYEKTTAAAAAATTAKKPFLPFAKPKPFASPFWPAKPMPPTADPMLPFKQRMTMLSQVFDMLTGLQRNITKTANDAMAANAETSKPNTETENPNTETSEPAETAEPKIPSEDTSAQLTNNTLLDAVLKKLSDAVTPSSPTSDIKAGAAITSRALPKEPMSFWVSYPENAAPIAKRQADDYFLPNGNDNDHHDQRQYTRGVQMQMHQGYQSLPAGSVESVQAGGGSTPGHQGGGIKLLGSNAYGNSDKWADWMQYHKNQYQDQENRRHHHNHH